MTTESLGTVDATPTKEFFVEMLGKDVRLDIAILDLVDNGIDGAIRMREVSRLDGLEVRISFDQEHFAVRDNCGGIPLELAKNYAFRFGRPADAPTVKNSVGRFGVGMKRALFKMGHSFEVATRTSDVSYRITIDVAAWLQRSTWDFPIVEMDRVKDDDPHIGTGTDVLVLELTEETKSWFSIAHNESNLKREISKRHQHYIDRGLSISLNGVAIPPSDLKFMHSVSPSLRPVFMEHDSDNVHVRILAGLGPSVPREAGWYVYCNGRMVLDADQTSTTGWGEPEMMPRFHPQYARFRGAVFFDSEDATLLPWNTTKDGVDEGLPIFIDALSKMVTAMRPVMQFLNAADRDNDEPEGERPLLEMLDRLDRSNRYKSIMDIPRSNHFRYERPSSPTKPKERTVTIQYQKPVRLVDAAKENLGLQTAKAVGEKTFDYYLDQEDIDAT